jgi:hypothetical protein
MVQGEEENHHMDFVFLVSLTVVGMFCGMLLLLKAGWQFGIRRMAQDPQGTRADTSVIEGAVFALLSLLLAFSFSGAASRFDARRQLMVQEANAIGTAYLRLDLLPAEAQPALRELFRQYLVSRVQTFRKLPDIEAAKEELAMSLKFQGEIWTQAVTGCRVVGGAAPILLLPALNQMIDITTTQTMATRIHPPLIIFVLLFAVGLICSFVAGYGMAGSKKLNWTHMIGFAAVTAITFFVILDIEFPRLGLIRLDEFDQVMQELLKSMK